jgi:hypothetical protein
MAVSELPPGFVLDQAFPDCRPAFVFDKPGMGEDAAKSVGAGLGQGAIGTLGMGGDIRELAGKGLDLAGSKLGFDPSGIKSAASMASKVIPGLGLLANAPTSAGHQIDRNGPDRLAGLPAAIRDRAPAQEGRGVCAKHAVGRS